MLKINLKLAAFSFMTVALMTSLATPLAVSAQVAATASCYTFTRNLGEGRPISVQEGSALGQDLSASGFWTGGTPITTYDDTVASAVSGFQEKYSAEILAPSGLSYGTGYVGALTRAQLNALYGCQQTAPSSQPIQCPAGYVCTPINQNPAPVCPLGFTCTPIGYVPPSPSPSPYVPVPVNSSTGPTVSLSGFPTIIAQNVTMGNAAQDTFQYTAIFNVNVQATNGSVTLGLPTSSWPAFGTASSYVQLYNNGTLDAGAHGLSVAYSAPLGTAVSADGSSFTIPAGTSATIPVTYSFSVTSSGSSDYSVELNGMGWSSSGLLNQTVILGGLAWTTTSLPVGFSSSPVTVVNQGNQGTAQPVAPVLSNPTFSLTGLPTIVKINITPSNGPTEFQYEATFNVAIQAGTNPATYGLPSSSHPMFGTSLASRSSMRTASLRVLVRRVD